jgi:hypothetical protein
MNKQRAKLYIPVKAESALKGTTGNGREYEQTKGKTLYPCKRPNQPSGAHIHYPVKASGDPNISKKVAQKFNIEQRKNLFSILDV